MKKTSALMLLILLANLLSSGYIAWAQPQNPTVLSGSMSSNINGQTMTMTVGDKTILNWGHFGNAQNEITQFLQPSSSSVVLNRDMGGNVSEIMGHMQANGQFFVVNPAGIFVHRGSSVNANAVVLSALDITNSNFLNRNYQFFAPDPTRMGAVVNAGAVNAGTFAALFGPLVDNAGAIWGGQSVDIAAGRSASLTFDSTGAAHITLPQGPSSPGDVGFAADGSTSFLSSLVNDTNLKAGALVQNSDGSYTFKQSEGLGANLGTISVNPTYSQPGNIDFKTTASSYFGTTSWMAAEGNVTDTSGASIIGSTGGNLVFNDNAQVFTGPNFNLGKGNITWNGSGKFLEEVVSTADNSWSSLTAGSLNLSSGDTVGTLAAPFRLMTANLSAASTNNMYLSSLSSVTANYLASSNGGLNMSVSGDLHFGATSQAIASNGWGSVGFSATGSIIPDASNVGQPQIQAGTLTLSGPLGVGTFGSQTGLDVKALNVSANTNKSINLTVEGNSTVNLTSGNNVTLYDHYGNLSGSITGQTATLTADNSIQVATTGLNVLNAKNFQGNIGIQNNSGALSLIASAASSLQVQSTGDLIVQQATFGGSGAFSANTIQSGNSSSPSIVGGDIFLNAQNGIGAAGNPLTIQTNPWFSGSWVIANTLKGSMNINDTGDMIFEATAPVTITAYTLNDMEPSQVNSGGVFLTAGDSIYGQISGFPDVSAKTMILTAGKNIQGTFNAQTATLTAGNNIGFTISSPTVLQTNFLTATNGSGVMYISDMFPFQSLSLVTANGNVSVSDSAGLVTTFNNATSALSAKDSNSNLTLYRFQNTAGNLQPNAIFSPNTSLGLAASGSIYGTNNTVQAGALTMTAGTDINMNGSTFNFSQPSTAPSSVDNVTMTAGGNLLFNGMSLTVAYSGDTSLSANGNISLTQSVLNLNGSGNFNLNAPSTGSSLGNISLNNTSIADTGGKGFAIQAGNNFSALNSTSITQGNGGNFSISSGAGYGVDIENSTVKSAGSGTFIISSAGGFLFSNDTIYQANGGNFLLTGNNDPRNNSPMTIVGSAVTSLQSSNANISAAADLTIMNSTLVGSQVASFVLSSGGNMNAGNSTIAGNQDSNFSVVAGQSLNTVNNTNLTADRTGSFTIQTGLDTGLYSTMVWFSNSGGDLSIIAGRNLAVFNSTVARQSTRYGVLRAGGWVILNNGRVLANYSDTTWLQAITSVVWVLNSSAVVNANGGNIGIMAHAGIYVDPSSVVFASPGVVVFYPYFF